MELTRLNLQCKEDWSDLLEDTKVTRIIREITKDYNTKTSTGLRLSSAYDMPTYLIPHPVYILNVFKYTDPYNLRFIMLNSSIPIDRDYTGVPFDYDNSYNHDDDSPDVIADNLNKYDLSKSFNIYRWMQQGCLPLCTSLTTDSRKLSNHQDIWNDFNVKLLSMLDEVYENKLPLLALGSDASWLTKDYNGPVVTMPRPIRYPNGEYNRFITNDGFIKLDNILMSMGDSFIF